MTVEPIREGKAARTRRRLQQVTLEAIASSGEFTGEAVAERAGVSTATFYAHFATKDHAIAACLELCFEDFDARMSEVQSVEALLSDGLPRTVHAIVTTMIDVNRRYRSLLRLARSRVQASTLLRDLSRRQERSAFAATEHFVRLGQAAGRIRSGDPEALTAAVRTVVESLDTWIVRAHPDVATEISAMLTHYLAPEV